MAKRGSVLDAYKNNSSSFNPQLSSLPFSTPLPSSLTFHPPTMSNNPTAIRHYKLLIDSIKFQLANILPDGAMMMVMEAWGKEFIQTWVSCALFIPLLLTTSRPSHRGSSRAIPISWCRPKHPHGIPQPQYSWMPIY